jgi:hypothetical protein
MGDRFFVWGGFAEAEDTTPVPESELHDGGIYDPASDSWTQVSGEGAPPQTEAMQLIYAPSAPMKAVFTKTLVLVLGGTTIGLYDAATDSWRTLDATLGVDGLVTAAGNYLDLESPGGPSLLDVANATVKALPFGSVPTTAPVETQAAAVAYGFHWLIDAWTGSKLVRWSGTTNESVGCDNLPPDFMGGCDPLLVITAYPGGMLMLEE